VDRKNLSKVYAASLYITDKNYFLNKEIFNCKSDFSFENGLAEILEHAMMKMYPNLLSFDFMVPVPRGKTGAENHMTHIAEILSKKVGIPTKDILFKKGEYLPQLKLKKDERITNVAGKIGCREQIVGRVILMDDMYTTGATMLNSAIPLREKGATEVVGFVIARAVSTSDLLHAEILEVKEDA
jgi:predicted amidophosphoribosyltransferase